MKEFFEDRFESALSSALSAGNYRQLQHFDGKFDFLSNDYLGWARKGAIDLQIKEYENDVKKSHTGSTGSRLMSGNSRFAEQTETRIAAFHGTERALVFNSGYTANIGLLQCLGGRNVTFILDSLCHASLIDGARMDLGSTMVRFKHNDMLDLEFRLAQTEGVKIVVVESVYSMDGDEAPLDDIADLCRRFEAGLVVDEAHAIGVLNGGRGAVMDDRYDDVLIARIYTYGKAMATHGAAVVGSRALIYYLVNFCRPFIYTTAPPVHQLMAINAAYDLLVSDQLSVQKLHDNIAYFKRRITELKISNFIRSNSAIQSWVWGNDDEIKEVAKKLQQNGFMTKAILSPTVKMSQERLRFCLHSYNTTLDMELVLTALQAAWPK